MADELKTCGKCGQSKPLGEFAAGRRFADGLQPWCRSCFRAYAHARRQDPDIAAKERTYHADYYQRKQATGEYGLSQRKSRLKRQYGISLNEYVSMLVAQGQKCAICGSPSPNREGADSFDVDHDHKTGKVRGLLCKDCNLTIGTAHDSPEALRKAADYLERYEGLPSVDTGEQT
jgi:hypothetical protein